MYKRSLYLGSRWYLSNSIYSNSKYTSGTVTDVHQIQRYNGWVAPQLQWLISCTMVEQLQWLRSSVSKKKVPSLRINTYWTVARPHSI